jgi:hypothetical protein
MRKNSLIKICAGALFCLPFLTTLCGAEEIFFETLVPTELTSSILAPKGAIEEKITFYPGEVIAHKVLLPEDFKVHYHAKFGIQKEASENTTEKTIPTKNEYTQAPGCYVACFSHHKTKDGVYTVGSNQHMVGQVRVKGHYQGKLCSPEGFENQDLRVAQEFKEKCETHFPQKCEKDGCRAGGNTSHWFF